MAQAEQLTGASDVTTDVSLGQASAPVGKMDEVAGAEYQPRRARLVEPVGPMQDTAYSAPQWLVRRDDRYIQVSELLYRIIELADGTRALADIASEVATQTGRPVSANNIAYLITARLEPLQLIEGASTTVSDVSANRPATTHLQDRSSAKPRSALMVYARTTMLSPRVISPLTAGLKWLFTPIVMLPLLAAAVDMQVWLFFVHGVQRPFGAMLADPSLLLATLGLLIGSAMFHELGHAAALRYGGGQARRIGFGLYVVIPALFCDVSEAYRLSRGARIRTDLGGFYFNMIFSLALLGAYAITGQEVLLAPIVLTDLDIVQQLLPLVRFDGYWLLTDLTGVPDIYSQMGPLLTGVFPARWRHGRRALELKWWSRSIVATYLVVAIPLLVFTFASLVLAGPQIVVATLRALGAQALVASAAWHSAATASLVLAGFQSALLLLTLAGSVLVIVLLARTGWHVLRAWSAQNAGRRRIAILTSIAVALFVAAVWSHELGLL